MINKFLNLEGLSTLISLIKLQISKISFGLLVTNKTESLEISNGESLNGVVNLHKISKTGNYNDLLNKPVIPTKTSLLLNDNGFIAIESDPTVPLHVKEITQQNIVNWNNKLGSETDPTVPNHVKNITQQDIINWNNKLDTYTETDPSVPNYVRNITQENINSWNNKVDTTDLATVATSGSYNDLTNKPTIPAAQIQSDWSQSDNTKKDYIKNKPTIPAAQVNADWNAASGVAAILNKPTIPSAVTVTDNLTSTSATDALSANQGKTLKGMLDTYCPIIEDTRSSVKATITGVAPFDTLADGQRIVLHLNLNAVSGNHTLNLTLNDGTTTGEKSIKVRLNFSFAILGSGYACNQNDYLPLVYNAYENSWLMLGNEKNTTYSTITQVEITAGTSTSQRVVTPKLLRDNFYTETEVDTILTDYVNAATYDSTTHKIYLKNDDTILSEIDASDFIKDGMVNTVTIGNGTGTNASVSCLIVSFNTDSGKENIEIPISSIFNADNYYTKSNVDTELAKYVTLATNLNVTGEKTFIGAKKIKFKQSAANDKLGFTLYNNNNKELSYLEYNSGDLCLGNYYLLPNSQIKSRVGFKMSDMSSGVNAVYRILTPHAADAKTPFALTSATKDFYFPLGVSNGTSQVLTSSNGLLDISQLFTNYYSKADIDNAGYLTTIPELTDSDFNEICV